MCRMTPYADIRFENVPMCQCADMPMWISTACSIDFELNSIVTKDVKISVDESHLNSHDMRNYKNNPIVKLSFQFALDIVEFADTLIENRKYKIADQVLRAGCSIGANVREAQGAESRADFIHKMKIALKEAEETEYWLELCEFAKKYPKPGQLLKDIESIIKILNRIVASSKRMPLNRHIG